MSEHGLQVGTPGLESVGPIAFGPDDVLFVADNASANIFAIDVADDGDTGSVDAFDLDDLDTKLAVLPRAATSTTSSSATWPCTRARTTSTSR